MTVLNFSRIKKTPPGWRFAEAQKLRSACADLIARGKASGWETGETEAGDPQLYLLGPSPDYDCILCISRLGSLYVLEDGNGRILLEHQSLMLVAERAQAAVRRWTGAMAAKLVAMWVALREIFEKKIEPALAEPIEIATHIMPQIAAFA